MRRTPLKPSTKPMKRSGFKRRDKVGHRSDLKSGKKRLRARRSVMTPIRKSAKNEDCTLRFPQICRNRKETTVWCHSNSYVDGKGMGLKARDEEGCYGCFECHSFLDGGWVHCPGWTREMVDRVFDRARKESRGKLMRKGLLTSEVST